MKADLNLINWLLNESGVSMYAVSKTTGIAQTTLSDLRTGKTSIERITLGHAMKLTEYAKLKMKEENRMKTWNRNGYSVEERDFDYDLHKFVVIQEDEEDQEIVPDSLDVMAEIIHALDNGEDVDGWENGNGETIKIER